MHVPLDMMLQHKNTTSHIKLGGEVCIEPQRPTTPAAWAKQRELYGTMEKDGHTAWKCFVSSRKCKELAGNNLFGDSPPPEVEVNTNKIYGCLRRNPKFW